MTKGNLLEEWSFFLTREEKGVYKNTKQKTVLLWLPWTFDRLGGVDVVVDRLRLGIEKATKLHPLIGVCNWSAVPKINSDADGRRFLPIALPEAPLSGGVLHILRYLVSLIYRSIQLCTILSREQVTIFNAHFPTLHVLSVALLRCLGLWKGTLILSFHGSDIKAANPRDARWRIIARYTCCVTACSEALANEIRGIGLFRTAPVIVAYNGIDIEAFKSKAEIRHWPHLPPKSYLLNVGNFVPTKGQDVVIKAFSRVAAKFPEVTLVLAGGEDNGVWLDSVSTLATSLGLQERVRFIINVPHDQVASLMSGAMAFVHTARAEAFGLVLIEAGALGIPIVATGVGGVPEVVGSEGALLYPVDDVGALSECLCRTLGDRAESENRVAWMSDRIGAMFSVQTMTQSYLESYFFPSGVLSCLSRSGQRATTKLSLGVQSLAPLEPN